MAKKCQKYQILKKMQIFRQKWMGQFLLHPNWYELWMQEKYSSLAPTKGIFIRQSRWEKFQKMPKLAKSVQIGKNKLFRKKSSKLDGSIDYLKNRFCNDFQLVKILFLSINPVIRIVWWNFCLISFMYFKYRISLNNVRGH